MKNEETQLATTETHETRFPRLIGFEKMFDRLTEITRETAARAHDFFLERGSQFGTHLDDWFRAETEMLRPAPVKITENDEKINVMVAVPGFKAEEIEVSVKDDLLMVSGESSSKDEKTENESTFYNEWRSNRFIRKLILPTAVEAEGIDAKLKNGVLSLELTKRAEAEATKVAVKAA